MNLTGIIHKLNKQDKDIIFRAITIFSDNSIQGIKYFNIAGAENYALIPFLDIHPVINNLERYKERYRKYLIESKQYENLICINRLLSLLYTEIKK